MQSINSDVNTILGDTRRAMTSANLNHAIATAELEFERLNSGRRRRVYLRTQHRIVWRYHRHSATREASIGAVAERIARLLRFRGMLWAKSRLTA